MAKFSANSPSVYDFIQVLLENFGDQLPDGFRNQPSWKNASAQQITLGELYQLLILTIDPSIRMSSEEKFFCQWDKNLDFEFHDPNEEQANNT